MVPGIASSYRSVQYCFWTTEYVRVDTDDVSDIVTVCSNDN